MSVEWAECGCLANRSLQVNALSEALSRRSASARAGTEAHRAALGAAALASALEKGRPIAREVRVRRIWVATLQCSSPNAIRTGTLHDKVNYVRSVMCGLAVSATQISMHIGTIGSPQSPACLQALQLGCPEDPVVDVVAGSLPLEVTVAGARWYAAEVHEQQAVLCMRAHGVKAADFWAIHCFVRKC